MKTITGTRLFFVGQLIVTIPILVIMLVTFFGLGYFFDIAPKIIMLISFALGWVYWSFSVKKWIEWAVKNAVSEEKIIRIGKLGMLIWSKNTVQQVTQNKKIPWI